MEHSTPTEQLSQALRPCSGLKWGFGPWMGLEGSSRLGWAGKIRARDAHRPMTFRVSGLTCKIAQPLQKQCEIIL